jgi:hypothetical protein
MVNSGDARPLGLVLPARVKRDKLQQRAEGEKQRGMLRPNTHNSNESLHGCRFYLIAQSIANRAP